MATKTLDFNAARAELRGSLAKAEAAYSKSVEVVGEVSLDVKMGKRPQSDLDAAREDEVNRGRLVAEVQAALAALDVREADAAAAAGDRQRASDEKHFAALCRIASERGQSMSRRSVDLADDFSTGSRAAKEAAALGRELGHPVGLLERWENNAQAVITYRMQEARYDFTPTPARADAMAKLDAALGEVT